MILASHHINYVVSDLDVSLAFYRDALGLKMIQDSLRENLASYDEMFGFRGLRLRVALFELPHVPMFLELFQMLSPAGETRARNFYHVGASHLAFQVDDIDAEHVRIHGLGYSFRSQPVDVWREGKFIARGCYLADPDGTEIELFELTPGRSQMLMPRTLSQAESGAAS